MRPPLPRNTATDSDGQVTHASCTNPECECGAELQPIDSFSKSHGTKLGRDNQCKACRARTSQLRYNEKRDVTHGVDRVRNRSREQIAEIEDAIYQFAKEFQPVTCRQIYYGLVARGILEKNEKNYKQVVVHRAAQMRDDGRLPYDWITDHTRSIRLPEMYSEITHRLRTAADYYRREPWADQACYIQIWLEKDALVDVLFEVTAEYGVPLLVARGYTSSTLAREAAKEIAAAKKTTYIYYFGDHDPSGVDARRDVRVKLEKHGCQFEGFKVVAVTPEQIESMRLGTRPTNRKDMRAAKFLETYGHMADGECVDVDAIPPDVLRQMVRDCIEPHIDRVAWNKTLEIEESERQTLDELATRIEEDGVEALEEFLGLSG